MCQHEQFACNVNVGRITEVEGGPPTHFMADVSIKCEQCGTPFRFLGLPLGLDMTGASVSFDGLEARLAIAEKGKAAAPVRGVSGFTINQVGKVMERPK